MKKTQLKSLIKNIVKESLDQKSKEHRDEFNCGRENSMGFVNIGENVNPILTDKLCPICNKPMYSISQRNGITLFCNQPIEICKTNENPKGHGKNENDAYEFVQSIWGKEIDVEKNIKENEEPSVGKHIDLGFYEITPQQAKQFSGNQLPKAGYEKLIPAPQGFKTRNGFVWLGITTHGLKQVWYIRDSKGWKLVNGIAHLNYNETEEESINEMSSTGGQSGAGMGYTTPAWGTKNKDGSKRALDVTKRLGFKVAKSISEIEK